MACAMDSSPAPKSEEPSSTKAMLSAAFDAETDTWKVYDLAIILHDFMSQNGGMEAEMRAALSHLTCDLVAIGLRLREHSGHVIRAGGGLH